jgi:hypothetical protein
MAGLLLRWRTCCKFPSNVMTNLRRGTKRYCNGPVVCFLGRERPSCSVCGFVQTVVVGTKIFVVYRHSS